MDERELLAAYLDSRSVPCPGCGYNLRGVRDAVCPECGDELAMRADAVRLASDPAYGGNDPIETQHSGAVTGLVVPAAVLFLGVLVYLSAFLDMASAGGPTAKITGPSVAVFAAFVVHAVLIVAIIRAKGWFRIQTGWVRMSIVCLAWYWLLTPVVVMCGVIVWAIGALAFG